MPKHHHHGPHGAHHPHGPHDHGHHAPHGAHHPHGPHDHGHHAPHGPAGLHQLSKRIDEIRRMGAPDDAVKGIVEALMRKLPKSLSKSLGDDLDVDAADALAERAEAANRATLNGLQQVEGSVLIAGELPPHLICHLLDHGVIATQLHDPTPHGHRPPHFRDVAASYPGQFQGVVELTDVDNEGVKIIVCHSFLDTGAIGYVSSLTLIASRLWPAAQLVAIPSDHRAPHHAFKLGRGFDFYLFWE